MHRPPGWYLAPCETKPRTRPRVDAPGVTGRGRLVRWWTGRQWGPHVALDTDPLPGLAGYPRPLPPPPDPTTVVLPDLAATVALPIIPAVR